MTEQEHLLTCLSEECVEVSKEIHKALRFGIDDTDPTIPGAPTQRERIKQEVTDLFAVVEMLVNAGILTAGFDNSAIAIKTLKVEHFLQYAREHGALSEKPSATSAASCSSS